MADTSRVISFYAFVVVVYILHFRCDRLKRILVFPRLTLHYQLQFFAINIVRAFALLNERELL